MSRSKLAACVTTATLAAGAAIAAAPAHAASAPAPAAAAARYAGPELKLIPAQRAIAVTGFPVKPKSKRAFVFVDPGIWLASLGSSLRFDVGRTSYARPATITQILTGPGGGTVARRLPASMLDGWNGLKDMMTLTVRDSAGKVVSSARVTVCPASWDPERASADSPDSTPYPQGGCGTFDPFPMGEVWGIAKGWAIDPAQTNVRQLTLTIGSTYKVTESIAEYRLLGASKKIVVRSQKVGFCVAPTDAVDMLLPRAVWQPASIGLSGQCGSPTALWVRELLPVGWGDTYQQFLAGQAFDITGLPNGTYYVEVIANPEHQLHETRYGNDVSLRKIILSGTKGHRHVTVPPFHGMDREG